MAHVKRVCARFLRAMPLIPSRNRAANPAPPPFPPLVEGSWNPSVLLLLCSSCLFRVSSQGQTPDPYGVPGDQRNITNLCPTEAQPFLQTIR